MNRIITKPKFGAFDVSMRHEYEECLSDAALWHGTGRYQYKHGQIIDVFDAILESGHLRPALDIFDPRMGEMTSLSLTRHRMYARIYADMHVTGGVKLHERYGTPRFWAYYFIMASILTVVKEMSVRNPLANSKELSDWRGVVQKKWSTKVHKNPEPGGGKFFNQGSDIPGNYPILIGIRKGDHSWLTTGQGIALYERRTGESVGVDNFTHIEVPSDNVGSVSDELVKHGYKIPVLALEQCELRISRMHFSQLVMKSAEDVHNA